MTNAEQTPTATPARVAWYDLHRSSYFAARSCICDRCGERCHDVFTQKSDALTSEGEWLNWAIEFGHAGCLRSARDATEPRP